MTSNGIPNKDLASLNPILTISDNLFRGVMGELISPRSVAVACAATGLVGRQTGIFGKTLNYSLIF
jgi:lactate permease